MAIVNPKCFAIKWISSFQLSDLHWATRSQVRIVPASLHLTKSPLSSLCSICSVDKFFAWIPGEYPSSLLPMLLEFS